VSWPSWDGERTRIALALGEHSRRVRSLPGIADPQAVDVLALQFVASLRREQYYRLLQRKEIAPERADPNHPSFDAERAVAYHMQRGNIDEAAWLVFLMTHFARPADTGWRRLQDVYGCLGKGVWDWASVSADPGAFAAWLAAHWRGVRGKFGNHRKYESLRPDAKRTMREVVESYVAWIGPAGHAKFFADLVHRAGNDPHVIFDVLFRELPVVGFGRLAKFDYLSLLGRYGIAPIEAGSGYLTGATGPARGARLLFDGRPDGLSSDAHLQTMLDDLDRDLRVGMTVLEDALCNWQKSPMRFVHFKG
jgi:hypothetical protein